MQAHRRGGKNRGNRAAGGLAREVVGRGDKRKDSVEQLAVLRLALEHHALHQQERLRLSPSSSPHRKAATVARGRVLQQLLERGEEQGELDGDRHVAHAVGTLALAARAAGAEDAAGDDGDELCRGGFDVPARVKAGEEDYSAASRRRRLMRRSVRRCGWKCVASSGDDRHTVSVLRVWTRCRGRSASESVWERDWVKASA